MRRAGASTSPHPTHPACQITRSASHSFRSTCPNADLRRVTRHRAHSPHQPRRILRRLGLVVLSALAVTAVAATTSAAVFTDQTATGSNVINTEFSQLDANLTAKQIPIAFPVPGMTAGQTITQPFTVRNSDALPLRYSATSIAADAAMGSTVTMKIRAGVGDCSNTGFEASGTQLYSGALGSISSGILLFGNPLYGQQTGDRQIAPLATDVLCIQTALPANAPASAINVPTSTTLRFDQEQMTAAYSDKVKSYNPLFYYRLNDPDTNARDVVNTRTGTYTGGVTHGTTPPAVQSDTTTGYSRFDGTTGYVDLPDTPANQFTNGLTVSAWIYPIGTSAHARIIEFGNGAEKDNILLFRNATNDGWRFSTRNSNGAVGIDMIAGRGDVPRNAWTQVTLTVTGTTVNIYINGTLNTNGTMAFPLPNVVRTQNYLAKSSWPAPTDQNLDGSLSEVAVFDRALTGPEIRSIYDTRDTNPATGRYINAVRALEPQATYRLNDPTAPVAKDTAGSRHGSYSGGPLLNQGMNLSPGVSLGGDTTERSVSFDGVNDYINLPYSPTYQYEKGFSISAWVYPTSYQSWMRVYESGVAQDNNNFFLALVSSSGNGAFSYATRNATGAIQNAIETPNGTAPLNQWTHVTLTVDAAGKPTIYVNGVVRASGNPGGPITVVERANSWIGRSIYPYDGWYTGSMTEVSTWNRPLSQAEVTSLWNARLP